MMWKANKKGIIVLLAGLALLAVVHYFITPYSESLADQVLALGFALLLFNVAFASWFSVKRSTEDAENGDGLPDGDSDSGSGDGDDGGGD